MPKMFIIQFLIPVKMSVRAGLSHTQGTVKLLVLHKSSYERWLLDFRLNLPLQLIECVNPLNPELRKLAKHVKTHDTVYPPDEDKLLCVW